MKDNRFIELLNLYIDRQITTEETAELEAEIQGDPRRQAVYRQYCQIHSATKLVYESFRVSAAEPAATHSSRPATVELFETRHRRTSWVHYVGGFAAAAACVGLFIVRYSATPAPVAAVQAQPVAVAAAPMQPVAKASAPAAVAQPISLRSNSPAPDYSAMLAALREQDEERAVASQRGQAMRAQSLFDDNLFEAKRQQAESESRPAQNRANSSQQAEFTAFQFQR